MEDPQGGPWGCRRGEWGSGQTRLRTDGGSGQTEGPWGLVGLGLLPQGRGSRGISEHRKDMVSLRDHSGRCGGQARGGEGGGRCGAPSAVSGAGVGGVSPDQCKPGDLVFLCHCLPCPL